MDVGHVLAEVAQALHLHPIGRDRIDEVVEEQAALDRGGRVRPPGIAALALDPVVDAAEALEALLDIDVVDEQAAEGDLGAVATVAAALTLFPMGQLFWGAMVIWLFVMFDMLDGAMARARGGGTRFGAVLDATCDRVPLQVGQFESDNRMDEHLGNMVLEGGGGGQMTESYELAMYFMARHTAIDCHEKRRRRGYLFIIGDETKPGVYVYRNTFAPGQTSRPHYHTGDRYVTVIQGTWWTGEGDIYQPDRMVPIKAGGFMFHPSGYHHYDGAKDTPVTVQIIGVGPIETIQTEVDASGKPVRRR